MLSVGSMFMCISSTDKNNYQVVDFQMLIQRTFFLPDGTLVSESRRHRQNETKSMLRCVRYFWFLEQTLHIT